MKGMDFRSPGLRLSSVAAFMVAVALISAAILIGSAAASVPRNQVLLPGAQKASHAEVGHWTRYDLTGTNLQDVDMAAPDDAWAVGTDGVLAHWNGTDWQVYDNLGIGTRSINEVEVFASSQAWAAVSGGKMLRYNGSSWSFESSDILTATMNSLSVLSPTEGWAGGESGFLARYNGTMWNQVAPAAGITSTIWGLDMVSPTDGWAVTGTSDQSGSTGKLIHFNGTSWQQYPFTADRTLYDVEMLDSTYGWVVGSYGLLLEWKDGNWSYAASPAGGTLVKVSVLSRTDAWAASVDGSLAHWDGQSWAGVGSVTSAGLWAVGMFSHDLAWAVGDAGTIYKYDGAEWTVVESAVNMRSLHSLDFLNSNDGWASGSYDGLDGTGLWHWDGTKWTGYTIPILFEQLVDVDMVASDAVWAVGQFGHAVHWNGSSWLPDTILSEANFRALSMVSPTDGWAVGFSQGGHSARVLHYDGTAWSYASYPHTQSWTVTCVNAAGANDMWMGGWLETNTGVLVHYDGTSWIEQTTDAPVQAISMVNANDGWAVGGKDGLSLVLHYRDGIWTPVPIDYSGNFFDVHMLNRDEGWMVGRSVWDEVPETFFHYQNGTWTRFASPSENVIVGVRTIDSTHAWAVSEGSYGYGGLLYFEESTIPPTPTLTSTLTPTRTSTVTLTATATATETQHPCTVAFNDVQSGSTFYPYVMCLACKGIVGGYEDGTFRPNNAVTRGQLSKIVSNAAGFNEPVGGQTFEDVVPGSTFYEFIERMASRDITGGYTCGGAGEPCVAPGNRPYFRPNGNATREQISKIVSNAAGFNEPVGGQTFEDVVPGSTFYVWIGRLALRGVISGYPCGEAGEPCISPENKPYFRPGNNAARGQTAKIVSGTFNCQLQR